MFQRNCLTLEEAQRAFAAVLAEAGKEPERPIAVAVVDDHGDLICYARMDNTGLTAQQLSRKKAYTAAVRRMDTAAFRTRLQETGMTLTDFGDPSMVAIQGGVCIKSASGETVGAIGVSGHTSQRDEELARVGLQALGLG